MMTTALRYGMGRMYTLCSIVQERIYCRPHLDPSGLPVWCTNTDGIRYGGPLELGTPLPLALTEGAVAETNAWRCRGAVAHMSVHTLGDAYLDTVFIAICFTSCGDQGRGLELQRSWCLEPSRGASECVPIGCRFCALLALRLHTAFHIMALQR